MIKKIVFSISFIILIVETGLRLSGSLKTYTEKNFDYYQSAYDSKNVKHLNVWQQNDTFCIPQKEFSYTYISSALGLADKRFLDTCNASQTIVFLGDSFVFGVGASQDSSLPVFLSKKLNLNVINAGFPGSDPFYQQMLLDSIFKPKGFNNYFFMLNFSDIYDYIFRGGEERFVLDNIVKHKPSFWFEIAYQHSYIVRAFIHVVLQRDILFYQKVNCYF